VLGPARAAGPFQAKLVAQSKYPYSVHQVVKPGEASPFGNTMEDARQTNHMQMLLSAVQYKMPRLANGGLVTFLFVLLSFFSPESKLHYFVS
jgi:hypothetical protein